MTDNAKKNEFRLFLKRKDGNFMIRFVRAVILNYKTYLLFLPAALVLFVFNYLPLAGMVVAFKKYYARLGIFGSPWANPWYENFTQLFNDPMFWKVLKNTVVITSTKLLVCFPMPILLALVFTEIKLKKFKRTVQTILYLPHFLSWVILAGIFNQVLGSDGMVNAFLVKIGLSRIGFLTENEAYFAFLILSDIWKNVGFASILYLAAIAAVDISLYEAAKIDGANRWRIMGIITLPSIVPTVVLQLILNVAGILSAGFGQIYNTYSSLVYDVADIIDTYVYRIGIKDGNFEFASALGVFKSVVGMVLVLVTNKIADKLTGEGVF